MIDEKEKFQAAENILADRVCDLCEDPKKLTKFIADPYEEEINDKIVMRHLCGGCVTELNNEI